MKLVHFQSQPRYSQYQSAYKYDQNPFNCFQDTEQIQTSDVYQ